MVPPGRWLVYAGPASGLCTWRLAPEDAVGPRPMLQGDPPAARIHEARAGPGICFLVSGVCRWFLGPPSSCTSSSSALVIIRGLGFSWLPYRRLCDPSNLSCHRPCSMQSGTFCRSRGPRGASRQRHTAWSGSGVHWPVPTTTSGGSARPSVSGGRAPEGSEQSEWPLVPQKPFPARGSFDCGGRLLALSVSRWRGGGVVMSAWILVLSPRNST